jgi:hypothetical protein
VERYQQEKAETASYFASQETFRAPGPTFPQESASSLVCSEVLTTYLFSSRADILQKQVNLDSRLKSSSEPLGSEYSFAVDDNPTRLRALDLCSREERSTIQGFDSKQTPPLVCFQYGTHSLDPSQLLTTIIAPIY